MVDSPAFIEPAAPQDAPKPTPTAPAGPSDGNNGFPEGKPLAQMSESEQLAYWKQYAQKHEKAAKALNNGVDPLDWAASKYNGLTPQQVADLQAKVETLETERLSADEKALKQATKEAAESARAAAAAEYLPQIQKLQVQGIAASIIQGDKLNAFMALVNPAALVDDKGAVDETKVMGYLTAMYGDAATATQPTGPRWQNFGQHSAPPPPVKPGAGGSAEAAKRFGTKTT